MDTNICLSKTHEELLNMMKSIHGICVKNGIKYSLTGGSLLGAIRENGFIPWDDDIDIMVTRENYELLREAVKSSNDYEMGRGPWLQHIRPKYSDSQIIPFIDVFILDNVPDSRALFKWKLFILRFLQGMLKEELDFSAMSLIFKFCVLATHIVGKLFTRKVKLKWYDRVSIIGDDKPTKYVSITNDSFKLLAIKHKASIMNHFILQQFEDTFFMVSHESRDYLRTRYGADYMTPPPANERIQGQHFKRPRVKDEKVGL